MKLLLVLLQTQVLDGGWMWHKNGIRQTVALYESKTFKYYDSFCE